jgi:hypothetical protein
MSHKLFFAFIFLSLAASCMIASGYVLSAMIGEINRRLPDDERTSYLFGHFGKYAKISAEYRRLYPQGRLLQLYRAFLFLGIALLIAFAWRIGMF